MPSLGPTELIIILVIVIVLFGVGRISKIAGEMGSGIRAFKEGLKGDDENDGDNESDSVATDDNGSISKKE
jgi:sec-independent protein translocase protein TatA